MDRKEVFLSLIKYWVLYVITPFIIGIILGKLEIPQLPEYIGFYILFIAPFVFFIIPYKEINKIYTKKYLIIIFGLIIPYLIIYLFVIYGLLKTLENFGF